MYVRRMDFAYSYMLLRYKKMSLLLDKMINELPKHCKDYVFVLNTDFLKGLDFEYRGYKVRRFKLVEYGKIYLMPDPIWNDNDFVHIL